MNILDFVEVLRERSILLKFDNDLKSPYLYFCGHYQFSNSFIEKLKLLKIHEKNVYGGYGSYCNYIQHDEYKIEFSFKLKDLSRIYFTSLKKCIQDFQIPFNCLKICNIDFKDSNIAKYLAELPLEFM